MGLFSSLFGSSSSSSSTSSSAADNRRLAEAGSIQINDGSSADFTTPEAWELADNALESIIEASGDNADKLNAALDTGAQLATEAVEGVLGLNTAFSEQLFDVFAETVGLANQNVSAAQAAVSSAYQFVEDRSEQDVAGLIKDLAPWIAGVIGLWALTGVFK